DGRQVLGPAEQRAPRAGRCAPAGPRPPPGVRAHDVLAVVPDLGHGVEVPGLEGGVERAVGGSDRLDVSVGGLGHRRPTLPAGPRRAARPPRPRLVGTAAHGAASMVGWHPLRRRPYATCPRPTASRWPSTT